MANIHIVSVGTSLLTNYDKSRSGSPDLPALPSAKDDTAYKTLYGDSRIRKTLLAFLRGNPS